MFKANELMDELIVLGGGKDGQTCTEAALVRQK
jgi:hypothetical protein